MKKVLILAGSPRVGGNSDLLCDSFAKGAKEAGHEITKIYVQKQKIGHCLACYGCRETGKCVQHDDMEKILEQMLAADVIVLATPVYFYSMSGQMKTLIDRTLPKWLDIKGKEFYFIATAADKKEGLESTMLALKGLTDCLPGSEVKGRIYGYGVYNKGEVLNTAAMNEAYKMGKSC